MTLNGNKELWSLSQICSKNNPKSTPKSTTKWSPNRFQIAPKSQPNQTTNRAKHCPKIEPQMMPNGIPSFSKRFTFVRKRSTTWKPALIRNGKREENPWPSVNIKKQQQEADSFNASYCASVRSTEFRHLIIL